MTNLRLQKRLAASIKGVGKRRVWLDPNDASEISLANSRQAVRKLLKARTIYVKPVKVHSRYRKNERDEAKRKGRHTGAWARLREGDGGGRRLQLLLLRRWRRRGSMDAGAAATAAELGQPPRLC